ncbi:MAG TPA: ABC transporter substrate-binding protein, partial [Holophaga sp.]|nr:ABC transporter substrate-binding protein [Holophaga sp.]
MNTTFHATLLSTTLMAMGTVLWTGPSWAAVPSDVLVMGQSHENVRTLDPGVCFEDPTGSIVRNMYANLVKLEMKGGRFVAAPDAAEKWEVAQDGKTWTFHLRKGLVFDNGDPLKA